MVYTDTEIDKVLSYKTWTDKKKIDKLLFMDCQMYCWLGSDSTAKERNTVKAASRKIYTAIKKLNFSMGSNFLNTMDRRGETMK